MEETDVFAHEAADVAQQAIAEGVARLSLSREEVYARAKADIAAARALTGDLMERGHIKEPPAELLEAALDKAVAAVRK
jgi:malate dehydrogenase (oxaloacetate-decarboxylating)